MCSGSQYESTSPTTTQNRVCSTKVCACSDGTGATGAACPTHDTAKCASCDAGFALSGASCAADSDSDGTADKDEECDSDPDKTDPGECGCGNQPKANFWCADGAQTAHQKCGPGFGVPTLLVGGLPSDAPFACRECVFLDHKHSLVEDFSGCADHTRCDAGFEPKPKDGATNPGCQPCGTETFTSDVDYAPCTPKEVCSDSQREISAGSATEDRECAAKVCTCSDGTAATGAACPTHDTAKCASCNTGFALSGSACAVDEDNTVGVTNQGGRKATAKTFAVACALLFLVSLS